MNDRLKSLVPPSLHTIFMADWNVFGWSWSLIGGSKSKRCSRLHPMECQNSRTQLFFVWEWSSIVRWERKEEEEKVIYVSDEWLKFGFFGGKWLPPNVGINNLELLPINAWLLLYSRSSYCSKTLPNFSQNRKREMDSADSVSILNWTFYTVTLRCQLHAFGLTRRRIHL